MDSFRLWYVLFYLKTLVVFDLKFVNAKSCLELKSDYVLDLFVELTSMLE